MMTFDEASDIWNNRKDDRRNSVDLTEPKGPPCRLVKLSPDLFAIQVFNTYAVRIRKDGSYVLTWTLPISLEMRGAIRRFSGVELSQEGYNNRHEQLLSPAWVDTDGRLISAIEKGRDENRFTVRSI